MFSAPGDRGAAHTARTAPQPRDSRPAVLCPSPRPRRSRPVACPCARVTCGLVRVPPEPRHMKRHGTRERDRNGAFSPRRPEPETPDPGKHLSAHLPRPRTGSSRALAPEQEAEHASAAPERIASSRKLRRGALTAPRSRAQKSVASHRGRRVLPSLTAGSRSGSASGRAWRSSDQRTG